MELQKQYQKTVLPALQKKLGVTNPMAIPKVKKIVINMGIKGAVGDKKLVEKMAGVMSVLFGQKAKLTRAKKSIATFKLREGDPIGLTITLRGKRMYNFMEKLINVIFPRIKDFRGISRKSFDGQGNYTFGFSEYAIFPEIDPGSVDRLQGFEVTIVTSATSDVHGLALLETIGIPFAKEAQQKKA